MPTNQSCSAEAEPVTEVADGQLPFFQVAEWEDVDYVRPAYDVSSTVEFFHSWVRVEGDNDFDILDSGYGERWRKKWACLSQEGWCG